MMVLSRLVWLVTGAIFAIRSLIEFAHPDYWDPVTPLDWSAVWLTSAGWILFAPSVLLLGRLASSRRVMIVATVVATGALVTGLANAIEDGFGVSALGTFYVLGFFTAWFGLLPLAMMFGRAGLSRLARLSVALFLGIILSTVGGGIVILVALGSVAVATRWATAPSPDPMRSVAEGSAS